MDNVSRVVDANGTSRFDVGDSVGTLWEFVGSGRHGCDVGMKGQSPSGYELVGGGLLRSS